jgi:hypothetical protein
MAYTSHIKYNTGNKGASRKGTGKGVSYGKVVKIVSSLDDPDCKDSSMLNGVYYRVPKIATDESTPDTLKFAYQGDSAIRRLPLPGEMVEIITGPGSDSVGNPSATVKYWGKVVNIWNHPHHGAAPDTKQSNWESTLLGGQEEVATINPLQANPGDTLFEGRLGQSLRFGGYGTNPEVEGTSADPYVILSNGQIETQEGNTPIYENVDEDYNSIYLLANHKIKLTSANTKRATYNTVPKTSDQYKGNQVVINGGRLYFNAKEESILLSAKESVGLNAKTINLDGQEYMCLDADKIFIGSRARTAPDSTKQPAILGKQFEFWMTQLLDSLAIVANSMSSASAVGAGPVTQLNATGPVLRASVDSLKRQLRRIQSRKVFIE